MILNEESKSEINEKNMVKNLETLLDGKVSVYPRSINKIDNVTFLIGKKGDEKYLYIITNERTNKQVEDLKEKLLKLPLLIFLLKNVLKYIKML